MTARIRFRGAVLLAALAMVGVTGAGCRSTGPGPDPTPPLLTVAYVVDEGYEGQAGVRGFLLVDREGDVRLCDAMAESYPPQCGGPFLVVDGIDLSQYDLDQAQGVRWSDDAVVVTGEVHGDALVVDETPSS